MKIMMSRWFFSIFLLVSTSLYAGERVDRIPPTGSDVYSRRIPTEVRHLPAHSRLPPYLVSASRQRPHIVPANSLRSKKYPSQPMVHSIVANNFSYSLSASPLALNAETNGQALSESKNAVLQNAAEVGCDIAGYRSKVGAALVAHIRQQSPDCIAELYQALPENYPVFSEKNMLSVAVAAADLTLAYKGHAEQASISRLHYFLRTGYYHQFYSPKQMVAYTPALKSQVRIAIDHFVNNAFFYENSPTHALALSDIFFLIDSAEENNRYIGAVSNWLLRWSAAYAKTPNMNGTVNGIFTVLFRGHQVDGFSQVITVELIQRLAGFAKADWMLNSDALYMQENATAELARFLRYENAEYYSDVQQGLQAVLQRYDINGIGRSVWVTAAVGIDHEKKCSAFNTCEFRQDLKASLLAIQHRCNERLIIRAQAMSAEQLNHSCAQLAEHAVVFHRSLNTKKRAITGDLNSQLELVIFDSSAEYRSYAGVLFGIATDNGGTYLEGEPSKAGNQARFIAYEAEWLLPKFEVWNLAHEYIHYLDGHYTMKGSFADAKPATHKTVWWIEGLAEYITKKNSNLAAITLAPSEKYQLSQLFSTTYKSSQEQIYEWGYLAVRFMFERHSDDLVQLIDHFKRGDYDGSLLFIDTLIGDAYDGEWATWLTSVAVNANEPVVLLVPDFVPDPVVAELSNGQALNNLASPSDGSDLSYYIDLPEKVVNLKVTLANGSGDADLYLRHTNKPDDTHYDCASYLAGNNDNCTKLNPASGRWHIRIKRHAVYSGVNLTVNYTLGPDKPPAEPNPVPVEMCQQAAVNYIQLHNNQPVCASSTSSGIAEFYTWVAAGTASISISLTGGSGEADLYARSGTWPTTAVNDGASVNPGNSETLLINKPTAGWLYIIVQGRPSFSQAQLTLVKAP